jgi:hypothetical protein
MGTPLTDLFEHGLGHRALAGWRAENAPARRPSMVPVSEAVELMGMAEPEIISWCNAGWLDHEKRAGGLYVRPVILSRG